MDRKMIARFTVTVTSVENASWQGFVEVDGKEHEFQSELQLLHRIMEQYPDLQPEACWSKNRGKT